jgi:lipopolysaccharide export system protein LptA
MRALFLAAMIAAAPFAAPAFAEKGDREKEIVVGADRLLADQASHTSTFDGSVVVTQGTMRMTAAKVVVKEDPQRHKYYVATGSPVTFRQKRDNAEGYIEGYAERAEFDDNTDVLKLFNRAKVKQDTNELTGDCITYDMRKELAEVGGVCGQAAPPSRVKMILTPPKKEPEAEKDKAPAKPAGIELKTDAGKQ